MFTLVLAACGTETPVEVDAGVCATPASERLLPLAVDHQWVYDVTSADGTTSKESTVEALEDVGGGKAGTLAYRVRTGKLDGSTVSWQQDTCSGVVRHREQTFDIDGNLMSDQFYEPAKPRVDETAEHLVAGATWVSEYTEVETDDAGTVTTPKSERWTVIAVDEGIATALGSFTAVHLQRAGTDAGDATKDYWFVPGLGKVREEGDQLEQLIASTLR